jgi:hypothetical protein
MYRKSLNVALCLALVIGARQLAAASKTLDQVRTIVKEIQRADYQGDRRELKRLYDQMAPYVAVAPEVRYWRGFAMWRRALNGFNDGVGREELLTDLELAETEFGQVRPRHPIAVEAKIGTASCLANRAAVLYVQKEAAKATDLLNRSRALLKEMESQAARNPRYLWVLGANLWYAAPDRGGGQVAAIQTYQLGLTAARAAAAAGDPLRPSWGEAELLMNLAWSHLHKRVPDLSAAASYAQSALNLVPYWHYVRDILGPQIRLGLK